MQNNRGRRSIWNSLAVFLLFPWNVSGLNSTETTPNPQRMWDPEKGSILGHDFQNLSSDNVTTTNQTVQIGSSAFLKCKVRNAADKKVSWIRRRDNHILTSGILTYSRDERFSIMRTEGTDDWILHIRFIQKRDEGRYECQVSTKTGRYGHVVNLFVAVPEASIQGAPELHVQSGSTISLVCLIKESITPPTFMFWFHTSHMINYDQSRGGITVETDLESKTPTSKLTITDATFDDSGNYTCVSSNSDPTSINVFVSEGDKTAAIQRLDSGSAFSSTHSLLAVTFSLYITLSVFTCKSFLYMYSPMKT